MEDYNIKQTFKRLSHSDLDESRQKLIKSLRSWYRKSGGLSEKQIELLKRIENESQTVNA